MARLRLAEFGITHPPSYNGALAQSRAERPALPLNSVNEVGRFNTIGEPLTPRLPHHRTDHAIEDA